MKHALKHIHFVGVGGSGMSPIAEVLHNLGYRVSGSDAAAGEATQRLQSLGVQVYIGHAPEQIGAADAIVASTTSTILVSELAAVVAMPERFLNAHWLNPAYIVPLVELSPHAQTAPAVTARLKALLEGIGKVPVICAATAGFIVPRLQSLMMNEAARMVEQGVASAEEIDKATRYGLGFRFANIGVVEFIDFGGNDILYYASRYLASALADPRYAAPAIVDRHMQEGRNGLRDGKGFYDFSQVDPNHYKKEVLGRMLGMLKHLELMRPPQIAQSDAG